MSQYWTLIERENFENAKRMKFNWSGSISRHYESFHHPSWPITI